MSDAVIIDAVRTPVGKRNGSLADIHPADLENPYLNGETIRLDGALRMAPR